MASRKPGNPESGSSVKKITMSIPRGGDYLDNFDRPLQVVPPAQAPETEPEARKHSEDPEPSSVGEGGSAATSPAPRATERVVELEPAPTRTQVPDESEHEDAVPQPVAKKAPAKKRAAGAGSSAPAAKKAKKKSKPRPRRADIGFRPELEEAADALRKLAIAQSEEAFVNRTDVIAQATCAVARAMESIQCRQVPTRGHYASPQSRIFDNALQEAFYRGVAHHYIKHNVHQIPDRLLEACYQQYRQRNGLDDETRS